MKYLSIIIIGLTMVSCDSSRVYGDFHDMENAFWPLDSVQRFTFTIEDTTRKYNLLATFRNSSSYPYYNIYFKYTLEDTLGRIKKEELKEYHFFDPKTGEPLGSGLGDLFDHKVPLEDSLIFSNKGEYTLSLQQYMRMDTLPFIISVGARVEYVIDD